MNAPNLAICWGPNLMKSQDQLPERALREATTVNTIFSFLLEHLEALLRDDAVEETSTTTTDAYNTATTTTTTTTNDSDLVTSHTTNVTHVAPPTDAPPPLMSFSEPAKSTDSFQT